MSVHLFNTELPGWELFDERYYTHPWELVLERVTVLDAMLSSQGESFIDSHARVAPSAIIRHSWIGPGVHVFEGCVVRDSIVLGPNTTIGHASEIARSIVFPGGMIPRFNYIGSSLLGQNVRLGGSTMLSSHRHDWKNIRVALGEREIELESNRFGSMVGDDAHLAYCCHSNPGTVIGARTVVMPYTDLSGYVKPDQVLLTRRRIFAVPRRFARALTPD